MPLCVTQITKNDVRNLLQSLHSEQIGVLYWDSRLYLFNFEKEKVNDKVL
ncbi:MAG: hypothetical protein RLZZ95_370, partial [Pseudomonadota bacterium]